MQICLQARANLLKTVLSKDQAITPSQL